MPPFTFAAAVPSLWLQLAGVVVRVNVRAGGSLIATDAVFIHPLLSVRVTE